MSHVTKNPVAIPAGVEVKFGTDTLVIKDKYGELSFPLHSGVAIKLSDGKLISAARNDSKQTNAISGTIHALVNNMVKGVSEGFGKKSQLIGMGYHAQAQDKVLDLSLGLSHPIIYKMPEGVSIQTPSQIEITLTDVDKQVVGQIAAETRVFRSPESYKGKDICYVGEVIVMKEAKKK